MADQPDDLFTLVDRPLWLVTAAAGEQRGGLIVSFVLKSSIDPDRPVVLIALGRNHHTTSLVEASRAFGLHLLSASQLELALRFGLSSGWDGDKLAGLMISLGSAGSPLVSGCAGRVECQAFARYDAGDRLYYWADVLPGTSTTKAAAGQSLLTERRLIESAPADRRRQLKEQLAADVEQHRPLHDLWRLRVSQEGQR